MKLDKHGKTELSPIRAAEKSCRGGNTIDFICIRLNSDPTRISNRQQMIYNLKSLLPARIIRARNVDELFKLTIGMIPEKFKRW